MRTLRIVMTGLLMFAVVLPAVAQFRRGGVYNDTPRLDDRPKLRDFDRVKRGQLIPGRRGRWYGYTGREREHRRLLRERDRLLQWEDLPDEPMAELPDWFFEDYSADVYQDDEALDCISVPPINWNGVIYVAVRDYFCALGTTVAWDAASISASSTLQDGRAVLMPLHQNVIYIQGKPHTMAHASALVNNIMMVPLRALSNALSVEITWDAERKMAILSPKTKPATSETQPATP